MLRIDESIRYWAIIRARIAKRRWVGFFFLEQGGANARLLR